MYDPMTAAPPTSLLRLSQAAPGVALITLARPVARNALSLAMIAALETTFAKIAADAKIRCVIIASEGPAFCAGHDLRELTDARKGPDAGRAFFEETMLRCAGVMQAIAALPQPVIAAVEGVATAAGCQMVAACDLAVAGAAAKFCTPGVDIGLFCSTPAVALGRNVAHKHAMEMLLTGDMISADDAFRIGLVNRVAPAGNALTEAIALAKKIAGKPAATVQLGKRTFYAQIGQDLASAYAIAGRAMVENLLHADAREGIDAFIDKRKPKWQED